MARHGDNIAGDVVMRHEKVRIVALEDNNCELPIRLDVGEQFVELLDRLRVDQIDRRIDESHFPNDGVTAFTLNCLVSAKRMATSSMVPTSVRIDWVGVLIGLFLTVGSQAVSRRWRLTLEVTIGAGVTIRHG